MLLSIGFLFSCGDDFLTELPTDSIPQDEAITSESDLLGALNGVYSGFQGSPGYGRDAMLYGDVIADNSFVSATNSNRFIPFDKRNYTSLTGRVGTTWAQFYVVIKDANFAIAEGEKLPQSANRDFLLGQLYAARALSHFELAKLYTKMPNSGIDQELGIPYVTSFNALALPERNTVSEVYTNIKTDFSKALTLLNGQEPGRGFLGPNAVKAILSRIALYQEDWNTAKNMAEDVINAASTSLVSMTEYGSYWTLEDHSETLFEILQSPLDNPGFNSLAYIYDENGYGQNLAYANFVNTYDAGDVRKTLFDAAPGKGDAVEGFYVTKWPFNSNIYYNVKVLRLSEMYLNAAEAYANMNMDGLAQDRLNALVAQRVPGLSYSSTGSALLEDILDERRKELAFEGHRLFDLLRYKKSVDKTENCTENCTLGFYDDKLVLPIPQAELDANANILQNPGY